MANVRTIHVDWYSQRTPRFDRGPQLAYQGDHLSNLVVFDNAPELPNYYLLVKMKLTEYGEIITLPAIMLEGPYWLIPNYYTQICQMITYQVCERTETGDYEHHSAEFCGTILPSIGHNGELVDQSPMFDPYMDILDGRVNELIVAAGDIQIDSQLKNDSVNPVQNRIVKAAFDDIHNRLHYYPIAVNVIDGSYVVGSTGGIGTNANLGYAEFSMLPFRGKGIVIQSYLWQGAGYAFLDADGHYITGESATTKGISPAAGELTTVETSVPYDAYSLRVSLHKSYATRANEYYFCITENKATKYIFVGDSYGTGFNRGGSTTGWIDGAAAAIGLKSADYDKQAKGGTGFCHPSDNETFMDLLNKSTLEKETVGHIVICGGYNDKEYSESQLLASFETFAAKAREKFPFAEICVGMISHTTNAAEQATVMSTIRLSYMAMCNRDGVRYLSNVEFALSDSDISTLDGVHPDQIGADHLILAIGQALKGGSASILNM